MGNCTNSMASVSSRYECEADELGTPNSGSVGFILIDLASSTKYIIEHGKSSYMHMMQRLDDATRPVMAKHKNLRVHDHAGDQWLFVADISSGGYIVGDQRDTLACAQFLCSAMNDACRDTYCYVRVAVTFSDDNVLVSRGR